MSPLKFEEKIGINFSDKDLLRQAFIHRSYLNENPGERLSHNERLEFLGDAVLEVIVSEYLYREFSDMPEGELTAIRAALVNTHTLARAAGALGMEEYLLLSKGEAKSEGRARQYILANTFEAFVGSLFIDQGLSAVKSFLEAHLLPYTRIVMEEKLWQDAKSLFQEKSQEVSGITPTYKVLLEEGPDHNKQFTVGLFVGERLVSQGVGFSKQEAEEDAARIGLNKEGWK